MEKSPQERILHIATLEFPLFRMVNGYLYDMGSNNQQWLAVNNVPSNKNKNVSPLSPTTITFLRLHGCCLAKNLIRSALFFQKAKFNEESWS